MKRVATIALILVLCFSISVLSFAEVYAVEHDGQITYYDSKEAALASYTGQGSIWSTQVKKDDIIYSPEDNYPGDEEHEFWLGVKEKIEDSKANATIDVYSYGYQNMSVSVMEALYKYSTISLSMHTDFGDFVIPAGYLVEIESERVTYPIYQLFLLYSDMNNWKVPTTAEPEKPNTIQKETTENKVNQSAQEQKIEKEETVKEKAVETKEVVQIQDGNDDIYLIIIALLSLLVVILIAIIIKIKNNKGKMIIL